MRIPFAQIDAFADTAFAGNPAAVMPLAEWLPDATLQAIARENNLSETAFLVPAEAGAGADYHLRWFTPGGEVALCGHATLASGHFVLSSGGDRTAVRFATRQAGVLQVTRADAGYRLALPAWAPAEQDVPGLADALRVAPDAVLFEARGYAVAVLADEAAVRACDPDMRALAALGQWVVIVTAPGGAAQGSADGEHRWKGGVGGATDIVSRVFVPAFAIDEDPVTGAAHAVIVPYWAKRLGRDRFTAFQASPRGGRLACALEGDRVVLGGACVTVIEGTFLLP